MKSGSTESAYHYLAEHYKFPENVEVTHFPDQLRAIIDELVSHLNNNQLDEMEDLIVNNFINYGDEDYSADDVAQCVIDTNGDYAECVDRLVDSMEITEFQEELEVKKFIRDNQ